MWILTYPGIPFLYYGEEQMLGGEPQQPLWPNYNTTSDIFNFTKTVLTVRKSSKLYDENWTELFVDNGHYIA